MVGGNAPGHAADELAQVLPKVADIAASVKQ
jgi:hypothetical protein